MLEEKEGGKNLATRNFEIEETIAVLSEEDYNGFRKELNYVSWDGRKPKYDIRGWKDGHTKLTKGIVLNKEEMQNLSLAALSHMGVDANV